MSAQPLPRLSPNEYLDLERKAETRSEYLDGRLYAMSGGTYSHGLIVSSLNVLLGTRLRGSQCRVTVSDVRVRISSDGPYYYPDVMAVCSPPQFADDRRDSVLNPVLIVEVLSPSTEAYDRGLKAAQYRRIDSLQEYVLVWQDQPRIEVLRRQPSGGWFLSEAIGLDSVCTLESVRCDLPLAEVYRDITFASVEPNLPPPRP